jgi:hypothetical protein
MLLGGLVGPVVLAEDPSDPASGMSPGWTMALGILSTASMAASAYHGYKRNNSVGWAIAWGALGALFPVITPVVAVAQGYGKRSR